MKFIDAHIHLDLYESTALNHKWLESVRLSGAESLIAVSMHLDSCKVVEHLAGQHPAIVKPAYGFHPEQQLNSDEQFADLLLWMERRKEKMVAVGEVGLPYYLKEDAITKGDSFLLEPYIERLEMFVHAASRWSLPIVLHAVYEDAPIVIDLLERYNVTKAHFHWFKGDSLTLERMSQNGYFISFTPDLLYTEEIQSIAMQYPKTQVMVETDGPWPFEGPFTGRQTHPEMIVQTLHQLAQLYQMDVNAVSEQIYEQTKAFFNLGSER